MRVFSNLLVLCSILAVYSQVSGAATDKHIIEYKHIASAIVSGKRCSAREISKSDLHELLKELKLAKSKRADKIKGDLTLTLVLDTGGVRVFQIKNKKIQESENGDTWSLKKNLSSLCG